MEILVPSDAGVMHAMTILPFVSFSSRYWITAHWRHAPTDPNAGCQQKYCRFMPRERTAWRRFVPS
jgi:hypothetical protein